jgi:BirA family biotin operon repressor/biotin-[acetyl-CoA-carboxylase] ligase
LNVKLGAQTRALIDQPATDLASLCRAPVTPHPGSPAVDRAGAGLLDRNALLAAVLAELANVLDVFSKHGFKPLKAEWERAHALDGEEIILRSPTGLAERAVVRGVTDSGALLVEKDGSLVAVHSAEISVRTQPAGVQTRDQILGRRV